MFANNPGTRRFRPGWRGWVLLMACWTAATGKGHGAESLFGLAKVHDLHLHFTAREWVAMTPVEPAGRFNPMRDPGTPGREYPWSTARFEAGTVSLSNVAVRFKGNSSYSMSQDGWKRPLRLDFNRGAAGRTWMGTEELSLNNNLNDATQFREALAYEIGREAGLPAPRTAFARARLTVEGQVTNHVVGVYTLVELVEGDFLKSWFRTSKGLLLKPERLPGIEYLGENWTNYVARYEPKTKASNEETARFIALTRLVAQGDDESFRRDLGKHVDIAKFLRFVAVTAWVGNYDSFIGNGHNYYLFQPRDSGPAQFIPWDQNEAFGGHPGAGPRRRQNEFSILRPCGSRNRLVERVLAQPEWAAAYRQEVERLQTTVCATNNLITLAERLATTLEPAVHEESPAAWNAFRRVALGTSEAAPSAPVGPPRMGQPGRGEDGTLAEWIMARWQNVAGELAGTRSGVAPTVGRGPGGPGRWRGPGGPGGPGGPEGPRRPGERPARPVE